MGRQNKVDLPYFELDCHLDDKFELIEAEYGLKGFAIVIKLYQRIYGGEHGYYCEFTPDIALLLAARLCGSSGGVSGKVGIASDEGSLPGFPKNLITDVVAASIRRDIFSERLFREYSILTSSGIQKQYLKATVKRESVELKKEYLLISIPENRQNVVINPISGVRNQISGVRNPQSNSKSKSNSNSKSKTKSESNIDSYYNPLTPLQGEPDGKERNKTRKQKQEKIYYPNDEKLNQAFLDFVDMRKKIKKPMTDRAVELAMKKLQELSTPPLSDAMDNDLAIKILEQSVMNCWQGLFELKQDSNRKTNSNILDEWRNA